VRRLVLVAICVAVPLSGSTTGAQGRPAACRATVVHHTPNRALGTLSDSRWLRLDSRTAGMYGVLFGGEVVSGRLALYAGGKNPHTGGNEKILWLMPQRAKLGSEMRLVGRRLDAAGSFVEHLGWATSDDTPGQDFPSIVVVPRPGCWRLTLRSGRITGSVVALVRPPG